MAPRTKPAKAPVYRGPCPVLISRPLHGWLISALFADPVLGPSFQTRELGKIAGVAPQSEVVGRRAHHLNMLDEDLGLPILGPDGAAVTTSTSLFLERVSKQARKETTLGKVSSLLTLRVTEAPAVRPSLGPQALGPFGPLGLFCPLGSFGILMVSLGLWALLSYGKVATFSGRPGTS